MFKKALFMMLAIFICISMVACKEDKPQGNEESKISEEHNSESTSNDNISNGNEGTNGIRQNGELPNKWENLTAEEQRYYNNKIVTALKELDVETIKELSGLTDNDYEIKNLNDIASNQEYKTMYQQTVGEVKYLPQSMILVMKSKHFVFGKWLQEMEKSNAELPESTGHISKEIADQWYESCYKNAIEVYFAFNHDGNYCKLKDGKIIYDIDRVSSRIIDAELSDMYVNSIYTGQDAYAMMVFGYESDLKSLGYDYIKKEDNSPQYEIVLSGDLDKMIIEMNKNPNMATDDFYGKYFRTFYLNETYRKQIQQWMNENTIGCRGFSGASIFIKITDIEKDYLLKKCTDDEKSILRQANLYTNSIVQNMESNNSAFSAYYDILLKMEENNLLDVSGIISQ